MIIHSLPFFTKGTPLGLLPVLEYEGKILSGSGNIARFLAEKYGEQDRETN